MTAKATAITRSRIAQEKGTVAWLVPILVVAGGMVLQSAATQLMAGSFRCDAYGLVMIIFGVFLIVFALFLAWCREHLKLNRWAHLEVIEDNGLVARFVLGMESRLK